MVSIGLVPLKEAAEIIGINVNIMHGRSAPEQIRKYIHNQGTQNQLFDINGYKDEKDSEREIIEKTTLFIEYLAHIEEMEYTHMQRISKVRKSYIVDLDFNFKNSLKFITSICKYDNELIIRFGDYYDFGRRFEDTLKKHCNEWQDI